MAHLEYWLQIENQMWDTAPNGINRLIGETLARGANGMFMPLASQALIMRRYTANWAAPDDHAVNAWDVNEPQPAQTRGTIPGAVLEAKVGDDVVIHFRNMDTRQAIADSARVHSLHVRGVTASALCDGTYPLSPPDPRQANKQGDRVAPGDTFDYFYTVPHLANAGAWLYYDHSIAHVENVLAGAFGVMLIRQGGEARSQNPAQMLRGPTDTPTHFTNLLPPPSAVEHVVVIHELAGAGECINGRQLLGNTPTLLTRMNTRTKFRVLNLTTRAQSFYLHAHRWRIGNEWTDAETIPAGGGITFEVLEGTAENGGGNGEWRFVFDALSELSGSLVVTDGGALTLGMGAPR
ncbi:MAG: multicopper oxidase domain-containing protein [Anaerolineales bacterium]|nr:multicopper oxidase domain-containing protein [Anaerolineales bacterium]